MSKKRKIVYVFQGGGALGTFQVGGTEALIEADYNPDMIVGISIGGINAAILAGNRPEERIQKLNEFWDKITVDITTFGINFPFISKEKFENYFGSQSALLFGQNGFYKPKLISPFFSAENQPEDLSFYDTTPLKNTLLELIDFDYLNKGHVRLCLGVTDLLSGDFSFFDSKKDVITVDHILASAALPPGFPPIKIADRYYVDGGVYANTPLSKIFDEISNGDYDNMICFMFDLFSSEGSQPKTIDGMCERIKDIQYSSHSKRSTSLYATSQNLSKAIRFLGDKLPENIRKLPEVQQVLSLGNVHRLDLVHIIYHSKKGTELSSKDYNFSKNASSIHYNQGYDITKNVIINGKEKWNSSKIDYARIYTIDGENNLVELNI